MRRPNLDEDVQPVSEFGANAAKFVQRVRETRRPGFSRQRSAWNIFR